MKPVKQRFGVPERVEGCHTAVIGGYVIEGHVPVEAIGHLLRDKPKIDGLSVPGMTPGTPGMDGEQQGPFVVYSFTDGIVSQFATIDKWQKP
ncbi:MAG: DUF411 domain-containing protein [Chloroflexi bacterium]|nr:DUF411 domain-containing protein [Chloroflexota bacterium]